MSRYLAIFEVSQKQAYIYSVNKLSENVRRSAEIAYVTSEKFILDALKAADTESLYNSENNLVYSGGGHIITEYPNKVAAKAVLSVVTRRVLEMYPDMELFASMIECSEDSTIGDNITELIKSLESKKAIRSTVFQKESFGMEKIDPNTMKPVRIAVGSKEKAADIDADDFVPEGYAASGAFENLGGSKSEKNYIAVVHIDGNGMGAQVDAEYKMMEGKSWAEAKALLRAFSEGIQKDYEDTFHAMCRKVDEGIKNGSIKELDLKTRGGVPYFPIRKLIIEGDDISFVTDGRIGLECAAVFLQELKKKNRYACAGVAMIHQKYPFFKAYDLAEELCTNAKKFGISNVKLDDPDDVKERMRKGVLISCVDWHIEQGEISGSISDIRDNYISQDKKTHMELRPYVICKNDAVKLETELRYYSQFKDVMKAIKGDRAFARSKVKGLRPELKKGEDAVNRYLKFYNMDKITLRCYQGIFAHDDLNEAMQEHKRLEKQAYINVPGPDGEERRSILFDAIELMDIFIPFSGEDREDKNEENY